MMRCRAVRIQESEVLMIELTDEQRQQLSGVETQAIDPQTKEQYILIRKDAYDRMTELLYDASPWTDEEMDLLAEEAGEMLDEYRP
jgi:hypothetical protein